MVDFPALDADPLHPISYTTSESTPVSPLAPFTRQRIPSRNSTISVYSHAEYVLNTLFLTLRVTVEYSSDISEIHAPVPRRHHLLQRNDSQWLHTADISPNSSRPVSPLGSRHSFLRRTHTTTFSALMEEAEGEKPIDEDTRGWGRKWVRWMHRNHMRVWVIPITLLAAVWVKWVVGLGGYSGSYLIYPILLISVYFRS